MILIVRLIYACAAFFSIAAAALTVASLFIAERAPQSMQFLGVSLVVGAIFLGIGVLLSGSFRLRGARLADLRDSRAHRSGIRRLRLSRRPASSESSAGRANRYHSSRSLRVSSQSRRYGRSTPASGPRTTLL